jgi:hypothetical protein
MLTETDADMFAHKLADATNRVVRDYKTEDVVHEKPFSDQLCGRLKETLEGFKTPNIRWQIDIASGRTGRARLTARTLTKTKEEPQFGADLVMALDINTPDYEVKKGFLVQAKRLEKDEYLSTDQHRSLQAQYERMLSLTPSSMVFLYGETGVHVVPAAAHWLVKCDAPVRVNWAALDYAAMIYRATNLLCQSCMFRQRCNYGHNRYKSKVSES